MDIGSSSTRENLKYCQIVKQMCEVFGLIFAAVVLENTYAVMALSSTSFATEPFFEKPAIVACRYKHSNKYRQTTTVTLTYARRGIMTIALFTRPVYM